MDTDEIMRALRDYIRTRFEIPDGDADFTDDVHLFDYGYVDSFGAVDLTRFVEQHCSITITQSDLVVFPMNSIREIATFAAKRKSGEV
jgi:methoxymalonate biosynthesis acyl carrier protein